MNGTIISTTVAAMMMVSGLGGHDSKRPDPTPVAWTQAAPAAPTQAAADSAKD